MRVAVIHPDGAVSAYKLGRIEDGIHNADFLGNTTPMPEFIDKLVKMAKKEFPGCEVQVQRMVMVEEDGVDESEWIHADDFDEEVHTPTRAGNSVVPDELAASTTMKTNGNGGSR